VESGGVRCERGVGRREKGEQFRWESGEEGARQTQTYTSQVYMYTYAAKNLDSQTRCKERHTDEETNEIEKTKVYRHGRNQPFSNEVKTWTQTKSKSTDKV
jgi:hypothetical protein